MLDGGMDPLSSRSRLLRWLAPSADPAARRLVVAGVAGILLTAPLSLQQLIRPIPLLGYLLTAAGAALALHCCLRAWKPSSRLAWVATFVCLVFAAVTIADGVGQAATALGGTDAQIVCVDDVSPSIVAGGHAVLQGQNVYTTYNVLRAEQSLGCPSFHVTALRTGAFATRTTEPSDRELDAAARTMLDGRDTSSIQLGFPYPAGSALAGVAGARGVVILNLLFLLAAGATVVCTSPAPMRRWVALALAAQTGALVFIGPGHPDGIVGALLIVACARREPLVSGVALGLACAIKQTAWFVAPALLILAFRQGRSAGLRQTGVTALVFALINGPYALANPGAWLTGVLAPQLSPEFPVPGGPVGSFANTSHPAVVLAVFTVIMLLTVGGGWLMAWRGRRGWAEAGVIVASLGLWDGSRSLLYYLGLVGLIAVGICARQLLPRAAPAGEQRDEPQRRLVAQAVL
jgi:Glycosyltransferase family 87